MNATTTTTRSRTAHKLIGSLGILGAAAAVAGMGTFGSFTDTTTPLNAAVNSGTLALTLTSANDTASLPMTVSNVVPGDSVSRSVDLTNSGTTAHSAITLVSTATTASKLTTDITNGLQLKVQSCPAAWTKNTAANGAAVYTCTGTIQTLVSGPAVGNSPLPSPASLAPAGVDHLVVSLTLPTSADNTFQGLSSALTLTFNGSQAAGGAR